jgi:hypothetical protein
MPIVKFHARVQYNDLIGTAPADRHDSRDLGKYLEENGLIRAGELVVGIEMSSLEVHTKTQDNPVHVSAFVATQDYHSLQKLRDAEETLEVRKISLEMKLNEFFRLFKRFEVTISNGGLLDGRHITVV